MGGRGEERRRAERGDLVKIRTVGVGLGLFLGGRGGRVGWVQQRQEGWVRKALVDVPVGHRGLRLDMVHCGRRSHSDSSR